MGANKPLGVLGVAALAFLVERPMHPYEMYQLVMQRGEDRVVNVSPGSLYRTVYALEHDGLVHAAGVDRDGARPERTTFEITDAGRGSLGARLVEMLRRPVNEFPQFVLAVSEMHVLERESVCGLLRERAAARVAEVAETERRIAAASERKVPRLYWLDAEYARAMNLAEIAWIEGTVAELESGALPWPDPVSCPTVPHHPHQTTSAGAAPGPVLGAVPPGAVSPEAAPPEVVPAGG